MSVGVLLHPEQLILCVGQADPQRHAAIGQGDVLFNSDLPGTMGATFVTFEHVEEGRDGQVHGHHTHVIHWRGKERGRGRDDKCNLKNTDL